MVRLVLALMCAGLTVPGQAQNANSRSELEATLSFETEHNGTSPRGWGGGPPGTIFLDGQIVHGGRWSVRLERDTTSPNTFSTITKTTPMDFAGTRVEWRGFLRSEGVSDYLGLWMREDGDTPGLAFDNMQQRQVKGTNDWTEYSITLPVHRDAKQLYFGVLVAGTGKVWADDLRLLVDGKPIWEAPKMERPKTPIDLDHEFDGGSGIVLSKLTNTQIENLALLGKVWGFLKYHHQSVIAGKHHWDYELFRVLPKLLAAADREAGKAAVRDWIRGMGDVPACSACVTLRDDNLHLSPEVDWIGHEPVVGRDLAGLLRAIYRNRSGGKQFYVSQVPNIGNPVFEHELAYAGLRFPDSGYQLLALYRFWNIIKYWYPYRNVLDQDWNQVLAEFIPKIALAKDKDAYQLEAITLIAKVTDTHANLWSAPPQLRPPAGTCQLPVTIRFIENRAVVTGYSEVTSGAATGLKIGDVIERLDGVPVEELVERWAPYYPASNKPTRLRDIARAMTRGPCSAARASVSRASQTVQITAQRQTLASLDQKVGRTHDLPGETFRLLSDQVAYLKLSSVQAAQVSNYVDRARATKGLVIDIRNYPSEFVVFALGSLLVDRPTQFARFTVGDLDNPGAFRWSGEPLTLSPQQPHYSGKVVILVDEISLSQAEYTTMAFRSAPQALVVGSTTAGADGNVSPITLPGGLNTMITGIGVFYPDKRPTQRVGIVPDVEVRPTIAGIRAGRDEVLEEALRQILGRQTPADQIERMARGLALAR
jgi:C-terminal processing protease CtpA/Prc